MNSSVTLGKVYIEALHGACTRRKLDAQKMASFFGLNGFEVVTHPKDADILILVTCAVSTKREDHSISRIRHLQGFPGELIVSGCLPAINPERLLTVHSGRSIPTSELDKLDEVFPETQVKFAGMDDANQYYPSYSSVLSNEFAEIVWTKVLSLRMLSPGYIVRKELPRLVRKVVWKEAPETTPFSIRVSWGCNRNCSYCGIRSAVGKFHSKPRQTCRSEFEEGLRNGYREFELIADDVGAYGTDIGTSFPALLTDLLSIPGEYSLLIWNLSPVWLIKYQQAFAPILETHRIRGIHYPTQSGSPQILKAMHRYNDVEKTVQSVQFMKKHAPGMIVSTDIMVGFPGETDKDLAETIAFIRAAGFDNVNLFMYYGVPNTLAHSLEGQVSQKEIEKRVRKIRKAMEQMGMDYTVA
ncbi:MAG: radical SAM protein [Chloroflexota bacterium]